VVLIGFSGGAAFAGGLVLDEPARYAGAAILYGTLPFDAGLAPTPARLAGLPVFVAQGEHDTVIPSEDLVQRRRAPEATRTHDLTDSRFAAPSGSTTVNDGQRSYVAAGRMGDL
jgi:predicted esterase